MNIIGNFFFLIIEEPSIVEPFRLLMGPKPRGVDCACHNQHQVI